MEQFDFTKPTPFYDVVLNIEDKKLYCNRALLAIWSPVFETMFKSNFRERDSMEINLPGKSFDDIKELLAVIYPPNRPIVATNVQRLLELADEYQMIELTKRCQAYLMQQRGTMDSLLLAQKYNFDDVIRRCADHLKHNLNLNLLPNCGNTDPRLNELSTKTINLLLVARVKHLETVLDSYKRKVITANEKFRSIKDLPGYNDDCDHCSRHETYIVDCYDCMRMVRAIIKRLSEQGFEETD
ncbi:unnamed protein product [Rotaria socialis]|uniref:BTB domain-containing protein n=1 Tax=Rotaria socialis TaxID=392032 RepID=A0A818ZJX6_9BILA|nr:unnamed protein product [Rotaria socialis]CAF3438473.1 unnamed protein product [Rotaria socialis]CAF3439570.1 unnamed protein product [Rotaria socialis]CAF3726391.1 unnamed protein product [Rotaria socialis]CAF3771148.1 unnamed protein product [Rotaria socialis]